MAPHSSTLACKVSWTEEPGGLQSMELLRVGHNWATSLLLFTFMYWRRKWQPTPVFLPGESQGRGSLVGCIVLSMGSHRVGHDWSDAAATAVLYKASLVAQLGKESASSAEDLGSISGLGRSPGEGKGCPLQYSGLENSMDCIVHGVAKSQTRLSDFHGF